jgi:large subunit ribosomal protein L4
MLPTKNENVERSVNNLPNVKTLRASYLNIRDLLGYDHLLIPQESLDLIEQILG